MNEQWQSFVTSGKDLKQRDLNCLLTSPISISAFSFCFWILLVQPALSSSLDILGGPVGGGGGGKGFTVPGPGEQRNSLSADLLQTLCINL